MMALSLSKLLIAVFFTCVLLYKHYFAKKYSPSGTRRPPGPKGVPLLGSVPSLPQKHPWLKFYDWAKRHGEIYECNLAGTNVVVISSARIVEELFVRRAAIYSDRPPLPAIMHESRTSMHYIALMNEGEDHKRGRRYIKHIVSNTPRNVLATLAEKAGAELVTKLMKNSTDWQTTLQDYVAHITAQVAWNDDDLVTAQKSIWNADNLVPRISPDGAIENKLPFLAHLPKWVPLYVQPWRATEISRYQRERTFWLGQMNKVKNGTLKGPSWAQKYLFSEKGRDHGISDEEEAAYATGFIAMIGGVLLSSPLQTLLLALILYPEWQEKAQDEITRVCGDRAPGDGDMRNLPTVRALIRECLRWRPPVPLGVPHVAAQDDVFEGHYIPKGTICLAAEWAMTRNEALYPDAETFRPERWLDSSFPTYKEPLSNYPEIKTSSSFGYGARSCPGLGYSETVLFTMTCTLLWSCTITKKTDPETGKKIDVPWLDINPPNAIVRPTWFPLAVVPRSQERIAVLEDRVK